jgi:2,4-didehydro-3-deoxy-L-rhamnonate hydrolase
MKLIRFGASGKEKTGAIINEKSYDTSSFGEDYNQHFFENDGLNRLAEFIKRNQKNLSALPDNVRLGPPIATPSKIVCIGLNYVDHARETKSEIPTEPVVFLKATTSIIGPTDDIIIPKNSKKTDWETELAIVIGKRATYISEEDAMSYVAGYVLFNDVSEREFQMERGGTWDKGKGFDTFGPMGPFFATPDEIVDPHKLRLWLKVNGQMMQEGTTADFIFKIPLLISYCTQVMTLLPGDIIPTGTPAGVGMGKKPPVFLKPGDVIEYGVDGLGSTKQNIKAFKS